MTETLQPVADEKKTLLQEVPSTDIPVRRFSKSSSGKLSDIKERTYTSNERNELLGIYNRSFGTIKEAEIAQGKVHSIEPDFVLVDIGFKSEGRIQADEFRKLSELKVGDPIEVFVEKIEDKEGRLILSYKRAEFMRVWKRITDAAEKNNILQGLVIRRIKGGLVLDLLGVEAFLPGSQIDVRPVRDFDAFKRKHLDVRVVKINHPAENVVVSHKILVEEEMAEQRKAILQSLEKGQILEGIVKAVTDFGVFVDLGGVDGLVHITDLSWGRIASPYDVIKLDQKINVVILDFDQEKKRISLGMKQLTPHPWENIEQRYLLRQKVEGRVVSLTDYGAFIEIEKGVEGLIHISEMSWTQHIKHPSQFASLGQTVEAIIVELIKDEKKLALSIKQLEPDPWFKLMEKYPVGSRHQGIVKSLQTFGAFVELEKGVDGLIHISDLSWTKKIRHPGELLKRGQEIDVSILEINIDQRRISLGHKQILENPWDTLESVYSHAEECDGKIVRVIENKGLIVELPMGVDGFVPASHLSQAPINNIADKFQIGDALNMKVLEFDKENKRIVLSVLEYLKMKDQQAIDEYVEKYKLPSITLSEVIATPLPINDLETDIFLDFSPEVVIEEGETLSVQTPEESLTEPTPDFPHQ